METNVTALERAREIRDQWMTLEAGEERLRARDVARRLQVSEAELVATRCGNGTTRLAGPWRALLEELPTLGDVMALTRNETAVHEKRGRFEQVELDDHGGNVLGKEIDLRVFLRVWHSAFVVREEARARSSMQFFDRHGTAVHKIWLGEQSNLAALDRIVDRYRHDDHSPVLHVESLPPPLGMRSDEAIDVAALQGAWDAMQDTHEFFTILRKTGCRRTQALRLGGPTRANRARVDGLAYVLAEASKQGEPIMVFVPNAGCIQIHTGSVHRIVRTGEWLNVLDERFNLHVLTSGVAESWVVRKPTKDGVVTSLEIFDTAGDTTAFLFGERKPGQRESPVWREIVEAAVEATPPTRDT